MTGAPLPGDSHLPESRSALPFDVLALAGSVSRPVLIGRLGGFAGLGLGVLFIALAIASPGSDIDRLATGAIAVVALAAGGLLVGRPSQVPIWVMDAMAVSSVGSLVLIAHFSPTMRVGLPGMYVAIGTVLFALRSWRVALLHTGVLGLSYAGVLWAAPSPVAPQTRWLLLMSSVVISGLFIRWLIAMVTGLAADERIARQEAELAGVELERTGREKTAFLARMSHELRTPLNVVLGFTDLIGEQLVGPLNDKQQEYVGDIAESARHLVSLVDEVLDPDTVAQGEVTLDREFIDPHAAISDAVRMLRELATAREVDIVVEASSLGTLFADGRKLRQVVVNLLINAVKYTAAGGRVVVSARSTPEGLTFAVRDTGVGIAPEDLGPIFEEFQQGANPAEGTGLGLPLARRFVRMHGGELSATSQPGVGSTFTFDIPYIAQAAGSGAGDDEVEDASRDRQVAFTRPGSSANRALLARVGSWQAMVLGGVLLLVAIITSSVSDQFRWIAAGLGVTAIGSGFVMRWFGARLPRPGIELLGLAGVIVFTVLTAFAGPFADLVPLNYGWISMTTFALWPRARAMCHFTSVVICYSVLLVFRPGHQPLAHALAAMNVVIVSAVIVDWVTVRLRRFVVVEQSARQRAEEIQARLNAASQHKSAFVANMSHELRTPLNAIIGFADLLADGSAGSVNATQADYLTEVGMAARHLLALINDLLDLARLEAGHLQLTYDHVAVPAVLERVRASVGNEAAGRAIEIETSVDDAAQLVVADEERLEQLLVKLLSNAVKFTPDGGRVDVHADRDGDDLVIAVRDTGIGILPVQRHSIFEAFSQGQQRAVDKVPEGTGVGLSLVKGLVELHGGRIMLDTQLGHGSTFVVALPGAVGAFSEAWSSV